jgi:hypothetical protein
MPSKGRSRRKANERFGVWPSNIDAQPDALSDKEIDDFHG